MMAEAAPGKIQITGATYALIPDELVCQPGGTILVKGKGAMETGYGLGLRPGRPADTGAT